MYLESEKQMKMFKSCLTTQEIFSQQKNSYQGLTYRRIPIPDFCAPKEQVPWGWDAAAAASFPSHPSNVTWVLGVPPRPGTVVVCPGLVLAGAKKVPREMLLGDPGYLQPDRSGEEAAGLDPVTRKWGV